MTDTKTSGYWAKIQRGKRGIKASCHPLKPHYAHGLCKTCYYKDKWDNDPVWRARQQSLSAVREEGRAPRTTSPDQLAQIRTKMDARLYNLLPGEREKLWAFQNGFDPITHEPLVAKANLDHDPRTGKIRGLLNPMTNKLLVDDEDRLIAMLLYIQHPPAPQALGETVYGVMGQAKHKKKMRYGPEGSPTPQPRGVLLEPKEESPKLRKAKTSVRRSASSVQKLPVAQRTRVSKLECLQGSDGARPGQA